MNPDELEQIRKRVEVASPGPWAVEDENISITAVIDDNENEVANTYYSDHPMEDAVFIAHARTDVPKLLDEIDRLTSLVHRLDRLKMTTAKMIDEANGREGMRTIKSLMESDRLAKVKQALAECDGIEK